jgi:hypothetical protein
MKLIYIIEDGSGNKKIGITSDIKKRITQIKTGVPTGIASVMVSDFVENARDIEKKLHTANKAYRLNGEWFSQVIDLGDIEFSYLKLEKQTDVKYEELPESVHLNWYVKNLASLLCLSTSTTNVLIKLTMSANYDNEIFSSKEIREKIATELDLSLGAINNAITEIARVEIIVREGSRGSGIYKLNPNFFPRGKWRDIYEQRKAFKLTITYSHDENGGKREVLTEQIGADILQFPATEGEIL